MPTRPDDITFTLVADGYESLEAPLLAPDGGLLFSDLKVGGIHRVPAGFAALLPGRRGIGGLCHHVRGGLVASGLDVVHLDAVGRCRTLLELSDLAPGTARAVAFNDLCADQDGNVLVG